MPDPIRPRPTALPTPNPVGDVAAPGSAAPSVAPADASPVVDASGFEGTHGGAVETPAGAGPAAPGAGSPLLARLGSLSPNAGALLLAGLPALETPEGQQALAGRLEALLGAVAADPQKRAQAEKQLMGVLVQLKASGQLEPVLSALAEAAAAKGALPPMPDEKRHELVAQLAGMVDAELLARGAIPGEGDQAFESWEAISKKHLAAVRDTAVPPRGPGQKSALTEPAFIKELEQLQGARFVEGNQVTPLIDGPASFAERDRLIDGAKKSIHLMSWAFYDDDTGFETAKKLVAKAKQGVEVRVIVDGQVAERSGHDETLRLLEEGGVEVVRWRDTERPHDGQHRKVMVVDGKDAIAGGLNVGNVYSHRGPADGQKWRDTDVKLSGPAVKDAAALFASLWNEQVTSRGLDVSPVAEPQDAPAAVGQGRAAVVNHVPGPDGDAHILLATLKAIEGASTSIDIENAYFIQTPALREALLAALERGVRVRILTNSAESVDEPIVSAPILASLPELADQGAEIYLKQGDTLHSKFLVVDGLYASVGSYNLHPRSHRYEGEMTINALDEQLAKGMGAAFEKDIAAATRVQQGSDIEVPKSAFTTIASRYFFDQL